MKTYALTPEEEVSVAENLMKSLKRKNVKLQKQSAPCKVKRGRKPTSLHTKKLVWNFWHENSKETSDTFRPAKLRSTNKPAVQSGLQFAPSVKDIEQRGKKFYESMWRINHDTIADLHTKFVKSHPKDYVSLGLFFNLRPFYVHSITLRDIEVCCCKLHLHARCGIAALIQCIKKHGLNPTNFNDYYTFLKYLTENCLEDQYTHISWTCTPNKGTICEHIKNQWEKLLNNLSVFIDVSDVNDNITVQLEHFEPVMVKSKSGEDKKRL